MGLFTRKKRDPPAPQPHQSSPSPSSPSTSNYLNPSPAASPTNLLSIPNDPYSNGGGEQTSKPPRSNTRFTNMFRSTSSTDSPSSSSSLRPNAPRQSFSDQSSSVYAGSGTGAGRFGNGLSGGGRNPSSTSQSDWDDAGIPLGRASTSQYSPQLESLDRYRLFGDGKGKASSTPSLPLPQRADDVEGRRRVSTSTARESINDNASRMEDEEHSTTGGGKWSKWKMGRGQKQRTGSMSSMRMFGGGEITGAGQSNGEDGGFVVKSFRTVSRVHEDPVSYSFTNAPSPPLPSLPSGSALSIYDQDPQQQESIRASIDLGSSQRRRPPLNVYGPASTARSRSSSPSIHPDRAPSPSTISVEAFRLASARSKSSISLVSLPNASNDTNSPPLDNDRPKFEPVQRPSSRTSRRQSTYSDLGVDNGSSFLPPRPRFAHHSNSSNSSLQSRKSSSNSTGAQTPPMMPQRQVSGDAGRAGVGLSQSESFMSMNSFTTANEPRTASNSARSTPAPSRITSPSAKSPSTSASAVTSPTSTDSSLPVRPANVKRLSSGDSELRWIASYADSITSNEITTSPVAYQNPPLPFPSSASTSTPKNKNIPSRHTHTPSFAVQPPTPATVSDANGSPAPSSTTTSPITSPTSSRQYPKRSSSLATDSTKAALQSMGIGGSPRRQSTSTATKPSSASIKSKQYPVASRGWMSDSSDEEEQEALETGSSNSDSDDEVPLSQIQSRSQTDLSLPPALVQAEQRARAELEMAALSKKAVEATESKLSGGSSVGLGRRRSNRRSVSTLSFSTAAISIPASTPPSSSTPNLIPSSPTRSILQRPHHPRSVSNPNSPYPASSISSVAPPVPAIPAGIADRSSSSSGTGSSSSALLTPGDLSPAVSDLGMKSYVGAPVLGKPSVKFDLAALSNPTTADNNRWNKGRRASAIHSSQSAVGSQFSHRPTQSLQPFSTPSSRAASVAPSRGPRSSLAPSPSSNSLNSSRTAVESNGTAGTGSVYDRMKLRHKLEAVEALKLGSDLNNPDGIVPEEEDDDEDEPLANLPTRVAGSMMGGMEGGSMLGGMGIPQQQHPYAGMGMGFGGAYSPLAVAPIGVDPYLCKFLHSIALIPRNRF